MKRKLLSMMALAALTLLPQGVWAKELTADVLLDFTTTGDFGTDNGGNSFTKDSYTYEKSSINNNADTNHDPKWWRIQSTSAYIGCTLDNALKAGDKIVVTAKPGSAGSGLYFILRTTNSTSEEAAGTITLGSTSEKDYETTIGVGSALIGKKKFYLMSSSTTAIYVGKIKVVSGATTPEAISANTTWDYSVYDAPTSATTADFVNSKMLLGSGIKMGTETDFSGYTGYLLNLAGNHNGGFDAANGHYLMFKLPANTSGSFVISHMPYGNSNKSLAYKIGTADASTISAKGKAVLVSNPIPFSTTAETPVYIYVSSNHSTYYIKSIAVTFTAPTVTLNNAGYATFASPLILDLVNMTASTGSVEAYKASVSGAAVSFTSLSQTIPSNTGFLLKGEAGAEITIPTVTEGTAVKDNAFLVNTTNTTFTDADAADYYYFAMKKNQATLTFATFDPSTRAIPADKAYLKVAKSNFSGGAHELSFSFANDGETTGIYIPSDKPNAKANYYNLAGQRVAQPTKGLYIVNGRKYIKH